MTYKIVRHYQNESIPRRTLQTGLTLEEAQEHCADTATGPEAKAETDRCGAWFDGYYEE